MLIGQFCKSFYLVQPGSWAQMSPPRFPLCWAPVPVASVAHSTLIHKVGNTTLGHERLVVLSTLWMSPLSLNAAAGCDRRVSPSQPVSELVSGPPPSSYAGCPLVVK